MDLQVQLHHIADETLQASKNFCILKAQAEKYPDLRLLLFSILHGAGAICMACTGIALSLLTAKKVELCAAGMLIILTVYFFIKSYRLLIESLPSSMHVKIKKEASQDQSAIEKSRDRLLAALRSIKYRRLRMEKEIEIRRLNHRNKGCSSDDYSSDGHCSSAI